MPAAQRQWRHGRLASESAQHLPPNQLLDHAAPCLHCQLCTYWHVLVCDACLALLQLLEQHMQQQLCMEAQHGVSCCKDVAGYAMTYSMVIVDSRPAFEAD
jgi:hypothetical protein